eukprot:scaffold251145_cov23-Prasinocladus_malaysianus.AAC.1
MDHCLPGTTTVAVHASALLPLSVKQMSFNRMKWYLQLRGMFSERTDGVRCLWEVHEVGGRGMGKSSSFAARDMLALSLTFLWRNSWFSLITVMITRKIISVMT